jgi:hypothetical protein
MTSFLRRLAPVSPFRTLLSSRFSTAEAKANIQRPDYRLLPPNHYILEGFTPYASRADLQLALGPAKPLEVIPLLDRTLGFSGKYELVLEAKEVSLLREGMKRYNGSLRLHDNHYPVEPFIAPKEFEIDRNTLRTRNFPADHRLYELEYFFEDFSLLPQGIVQVHTHSNYRSHRPIIPYKIAHQYLVYFSSAEEAERAMIELDGRGMKDLPHLHLLWYHA